MTDMNINNNYNNINFGQKIPTSSFFKMGSGIFSFEDAKNLCNAFEVKFPGHVGYYRNALHYVEKIEHRNPDLRELVHNIAKLQQKKLKLEEIEKITKALGEEIDVII